MSEFRDMCSVFAVSMMADAAIAYDASLNENDLEDFTHGGVLSAYTLSDPDGRKRNKSFVPARSGLSNKRVERVEDVVSLGDEILVRVIDIKPDGKIDLTHKGLLPDDRR